MSSNRYVHNCVDACYCFLKIESHQSYNVNDDNEEAVEGIIRMYRRSDFTEKGFIYNRKKNDVSFLR